jgi:hypothetical protein
MSIKKIDPIRKRKIQRIRQHYALDQLRLAGVKVNAKYIFEDKIKFTHKGEVVTLYPFTGWFFGKSITKGRGINNLIKLVW